MTPARMQAYLLVSLRPASSSSRQLTFPIIGRRARKIQPIKPPLVLRVPTNLGVFVENVEGEVRELAHLVLDQRDVK